MSVVGCDWEKLKRFNLAELYLPTKPPTPNKAEATPNAVMTDEARPINANLSATTDNLAT